MIDVHAPHEATHTWTDFLIHIATIVVGLVIAIGLEQAVEFLRHKHEIREARAALAAEHEENIRRYHDNVNSHLLRTANQHNDQRILRFLLAHPATPEDKLPGIMVFGAITIQEPVESAWITVEHTEVISLLPPAEVRAYAAEYTELERESTMFHALQDHLTLCAAYLTHTADVSSLTPTEIQSELACQVSAQSFEPSTATSSPSSAA
ncbi:MAG TPA: hypothetical protein VHY48_00460 [Acidobacteriaceae bacterium]|jgi:hypothetical protein|nr:hypothetical protein [Acidobacteriaceae bacterium]